MKLKYGQRIILKDGRNAIYLKSKRKMIYVLLLELIDNKWRILKLINVDKTEL